MKINAYVEWQRYLDQLASAETRQSDRSAYHPLYLRLKDSSAHGIRHFRSALEALNRDAKSAPVDTPIVFQEFHESQIVAAFLRHLDSGAAAKIVAMDFYTFVYFQAVSIDDDALTDKLLALADLIHIGPSVKVDLPDETSRFRLNLNAPANRDQGPPICAVIDDGIGFLNRRFTRFNSDNQLESRFGSVWIQSREKVRDADAQHGFQVASGRVLDKPEIDTLIASASEADEYSVVNASLFSRETHRSVMFASSHGTHIADLACGSHPHDNDPLMQSVDMLAVQMPPASIRETTGKRLDINLMQAVRWTLFRALLMSWTEYDSDEGSVGGEFLQRPLVINISLGVTAGPKDGSGFLEQQLAKELDLFKALSSDTPVRVVLAFGNDYRSRQIATLDSSKPRATLQWRIQPDDRNSNYLEIRPFSSRPVGLRLTPPGGPVQSFTLCSGLGTQDVTDGKKIIARLHEDVAAIGAADKASFVLATLPTASEAGFVAPAGAWEIELEPASDGQGQRVSLQIQRGDTPVGYRILGRQSYFDHPDAFELDEQDREYSDPGSSPISRQGSHSALASAPDPRIFSVGAIYENSYRDANVPEPARYSAAGAADADVSNVAGPDFSAVGDESVLTPGVLAAGTLSNTVVRLSGTSVAAPQVSRQLLLEFLGAAEAIPKADSPRLQVGQLVPKSSRDSRHFWS